MSADIQRVSKSLVMVVAGRFLATAVLGIVSPHSICLSRAAGEVALSPEQVEDTEVHALQELRNEPPRNPFLADSPWPMSHRNPYNQASSPLPGPTEVQDAQPEFLEGEPVAITLAMSGAYPDGRRAIWGNTLRHVFKLDGGSSRLEYCARLPRTQSRERAISGAYSLVDKDGTFFVPRGTTIEAYGDADHGNIRSAIIESGSFVVPDNLCLHEDESIVGINMTYDGRIIFVTSYGLVGSLARELDDLAWIRVGNGREKVSNSVAVDETGGIFVVTNKSMYRIQWRGESQQLKLSWSVPYRTNDVRVTGSLGPGSGTTPSLLGTGDQDKFVAICDGQTLMHLVLFWRDEIPADWPGLPDRDRRIAAEVPVTFGDPDATRSKTEQSLTVRGYGLAVVSNLYGRMDGPLIRRFIRKRFNNDLHTATIYKSNYAVVAPYGVEKFTWNPQKRKVESVWSSPVLSCPNGIPTMSEATGLFYFIGQSDSNWTLEAVNWETGESVFQQKISRSFKYNSFYSATEIGLEGSILSGAYGGIMRFGGWPTKSVNID